MFLKATGLENKVSTTYSPR